jgi:hypothetical protein
MNQVIARNVLPGQTVRVNGVSAGVVEAFTEPGLRVQYTTLVLDNYTRVRVPHLTPVWVL